MSTFVSLKFLGFLGFLLENFLNFYLQLPFIMAQAPPPDDLPPNTGGQSAGSRGCNISQTNPLQLLTPRIGALPLKTTTPTFSWYQGNLDVKQFDFRIFQQIEAEKIPELIVELHNPPIRLEKGIATLEWPITLNPLKVDSAYIWQVELVCDPNRPSGNFFADAPFVVDTNAEPTRLIYGPGI